MDVDQPPLFARFKANPPARAEMIDDFARRIGFDLPADYRAFLKQANGGEGFFGQNNYLALWLVTYVPDLNQTYEVARAAPGLVVFGSNGGGEAILRRLSPFLSS